jgi:hypothetical protein
MLTGTGFSDDAFFSHPARQQSLTQAVVDFMGASVVEVFALKPDLRTTQFF